MTIEMFCDRCGVEIPVEVLGGCRLRTGKSEMSFHLCADHQKELIHLVDQFCENDAPRNVAPTLSSKEER
jgi:hypothetical protein